MRGSLTPSATPQPYADPYVAGVALGLVLLAAFVFAGRGLGASGAFASLTAAAVNVIDPAAAAASPVLGRYVAEVPKPWADWLVVELVGVAIGAALSARLAGRLAARVERGAGVRIRIRLGHALAGGIAMGAGAILARGCTSGLALSGGALLSVGSWGFMLAAFAGAYAAAPMLRRTWLPDVRASLVTAQVEESP